MNKTGTEYLERANALTTLFQGQTLAEREICLIVSLKLFPDSPACGIGLFELRPAGEYVLKATFGIPERAQANWETGCISVNSPVVEAMRTSEVVFVSSSEDMQQRYPEHYAQHNSVSQSAVIVVPIRSLGSTVGAFAVFGSEFAVNNECRLFLEIVAGLIALKLNVNSKLPQAHQQDHRHPLRDEALTNRELLVQKLMKSGKTNLEIADELGYSESTIRQDAVSMFIKLGVKNRKAAGDLLDSE